MRRLVAVVEVAVWLAILAVSPSQRRALRDFGRWAWGAER